MVTVPIYGAAEEGRGAQGEPGGEDVAGEQAAGEAPAGAGVEKVKPAGRSFAAVSAGTNARSVIV